MERPFVTFNQFTPTGFCPLAIYVIAIGIQFAFHATPKVNALMSTVGIMRIFTIAVAITGIKPRDRFNSLRYAAPTRTRSPSKKYVIRQCNQDSSLKLLYWLGIHLGYNILFLYYAVLDNIVLVLHLLELNCNPPNHKNYHLTLSL